MLTMSSDLEMLMPIHDQSNCLHFNINNNTMFNTVFLVIPCRGNGQTMQIFQRNHFTSHMKRMVVVARVQDEIFSFVKVCWNSIV